MPVKRSRAGRSSSFGDAGFFGSEQVTGSPEQCSDKQGTTGVAAAAAAGGSSKGPGDSSVTMKSPEVVGDCQSGKNILMVASPEVDKGKGKVVVSSEEEMIGAFLDKCYYCEKKILDNAEVFMYGYLRAFCTSECRNEQIILDKALEKMSGEPIDAMNEDPKVDNAKNQFGFEKGKKAAP